MVQTLFIHHLLKKRNKLVRGRFILGSMYLEQYNLFNCCKYRDQYGFLKSSQWITEDKFNGFENYYAPIMKRRLLKWRQLLSDNNDQWPVRNSKSKGLEYFEGTYFVLTHIISL